MRVDDRNLAALAAESGRAQETEKSNRNQGVPTGTAATDNSSDHIILSSTMETLSRAMSEFGLERTSHVRALAVQYHDGSYHTDAAATAGGMVAEALLAEGQ